VKVRVGVFMKGSEAILRAIANEGGTIDAFRLEEWIVMLLKAGLIEKGERFTYHLTEPAKQFLRKKGVEI